MHGNAVLDYGGAGRYSAPLPAATSFGAQQPTGPHRVRWTYRVDEQHRLIVAQMIQRVLMSLDGRRLLRRIELARHGIWLVVFHAEPAQQRDQPERPRSN